MVQRFPSSSPIVSVIIPLYNKELTVARAIHSVLRQSVSDFEIIVVNDGSTDKSYDAAVAIHDQRIHVISQENVGPGGARNAGAAFSKAPLLAFLDADDEWAEQFLENGIAALMDWPECIAYACGYDSQSFRAQRPNKVAAFATQPGPSEVNLNSTGAALKMRVDALHSSCVVIRRSVFFRANGFYDRNRCVYGEDSFLWAQILFDGRIFWDPCELVIFHVEDSDLGYAKKYRRSARPLVLHKASLLSRFSESKKEAFQRMIVEFSLKDIETLLISGRICEAIFLRISNKNYSVSLFFRDIKFYAGSAFRRYKSKYTLRRLGSKN